MQSGLRRQKTSAPCALDSRVRPRRIQAVRAHGNRCDDLDRLFADSAGSGEEKSEQRIRRGTAPADASRQSGRFVGGEPRFEDALPREGFEGTWFCGGVKSRRESVPPPQPVTEAVPAPVFPGTQYSGAPTAPRPGVSAASRRRTPRIHRIPRLAFAARPHRSGAK